MASNGKVGPMAVIGQTLVNRLLSTYLATSSPFVRSLPLPLFLGALSDHTEPSFPRRREPRGERRVGCPGPPLLRGRRDRFDLVKSRSSACSIVFMKYWLTILYVYIEQKLQ